MAGTKPITARTSPEEKAAIEAAQQALGPEGQYTATTHTIWHKAAGKQFWKCRCHDPFPMLDRSGQVVVNDDGTPRMRTCPPLRMEAASKDAAIEAYRNDQSLPLHARIVCEAVEVRTPSIIQQQLTSQKATRTDG